MKFSVDPNHKDKKQSLSIAIYAGGMSKARERLLSVPHLAYKWLHYSRYMKRGKAVSFIGTILSLALLTSFLVHLSPASVAAQTSCPAKNVQHWDKIIFAIKSSKLAAKVKLPVNTELDIKVRDDPTKVADLKLKVLQFLNVPTEPRSSIDILEVRYAMICAG